MQHHQTQQPPKTISTLQDGFGNLLGVAAAFMGVMKLDEFTLPWFKMLFLSHISFGSYELWKLVWLIVQFLLIISAVKYVFSVLINAVYTAFAQRAIQRVLRANRGRYR